jgi:hypothetical protein
MRARGRRKEFKEFEEFKEFGRDELPITPSLRRGKLCYSRHLTPGGAP